MIGQLLAKATGFRGYEKVQLLGVYNTKKLAKEEWTQEPKSLAGILGVEHNLYWMVYPILEVIVFFCF